MKGELQILQNVMLLARAAQLVLEDEVLHGNGLEEVNNSRANILRLLGRQGRQSVKNIASFLGQSTAGASLNVEALVQAELVTREPDARDRRGVCVTLTSRGRQWLHQAERRQRELVGEATSSLTPQELGSLSKRIRTLAFALLKQSTAEPGRCLQCCAYESAACVSGPDGWHCSSFKHARAGQAKPQEVPVDEG